MRRPWRGFHTTRWLGMYTWLAQRLHRVEEGKNVLVPWVSLHEQFGQWVRPVFVRTLRQVKVVYPGTKFDLNQGGMKLWHSRPPVARGLLPVRGPKS